MNLEKKLGTNKSEKKQLQNQLAQLILENTENLKLAEDLSNFRDENKTLHEKNLNQREIILKMTNQQEKLEIDFLQNQQIMEYEKTEHAKCETELEQFKSENEKLKIEANRLVKLNREIILNHQNLAAENFERMKVQKKLLVYSNEENTHLKYQNEKLQKELFDAKVAEENMMKKDTEIKLHLE